MMKKTTIVLTALILAGSAASGERLVVPLSDPERPVFVQAELINGSITVETYDGRDVIVEVSPRQMAVLAGAEEMTAEETTGDPRTDGLRRLPSAGLGFSVEEDDNVVEISTDSWKQTIDVSLRVPVAASLSLKTVNHGEIKVRGVRGEIELGNVNGPIEALDVGGSVVAHTTNGEVRVELVSVTADKPMAFSTLNGNVDVTFPADLKAELRMRSDNGDILTDFEVVLTETEPRVERESEGGRFRLRMESETRGTVGGGGPEMTFRTWNGDVIVRKGG